jgi:hypothetical protein
MSDEGRCVNVNKLGDVNNEKRWIDLERSIDLRT